MTKQEYMNGFGILPSDIESRAIAREWREYHRSDEGRDEREVLVEMFGDDAPAILANPQSN